MTVIASDGRPLVPYETDGLVIHIGERYDVYITADKPGGLDNYWIRFSKLKLSVSQFGASHTKTLFCSNFKKSVTFELTY